MGKNLVEIIVTAEDRASGVLKGLSSGFTMLGGVALAGAGVAASAIAGLGVAAFNASNDTRTAALDMQSQFGMTADEAERAAKLARDSWANNWGDSIGDVGAVMGGVIQQLGEFGVVSDEAIRGATEDAIALRDSFGVETAGSIDAARALMERFGLTSEQAFDLMATGLQSGLSANGDFLESITEYAPVFEGAGFSAEQMYSIMESGAASGILGTDKIADAVKEMGLKLNEGSDDTKAAFDTIGMSFDDIAGFVASGDETWADYFDDIVAGINGIEDPIERQKAQVAIFGTMAEDLGVNFTEGLTAAGASLEEFGGATDSLNAKYESFGSLWEGIKRTFINAFTPLSDFVLGLATKYLPKVQEVIGVISEKLGTFIGAFTDSFSDGGDVIGSLVVAFQSLVGPTSDAGKTILNIGLALKDIKDKIVEFAAPIVEAIANFVSFKDVLIAMGIGIAAIVIPAIVSLVLSMAPILLTVGAVIGIVALLRNAWESDFAGIQEKTAVVIDFIQAVITAGLAAIRAFWDEHGAAIVAAAQQAWGLIQSYIEGVIETIYTVFEAFRALFEGDWETFGEKINEAWQTAWNTVVAFLGGLWDMIKPWLASVWESIRNWFTTTDWPALGRAVIDGIVNGLRAAGSAIRDILMGFAQDAWNAVMNFFTGGGRSGRSANRSGGVVTAPIGVPLVAPFNGSASGRSNTDSGRSTVVNIDARGAARGVDRDLRAMVEKVMREYGSRADIRVRTA